MRHAVRARGKGKGATAVFVVFASLLGVVACGGTASVRAGPEHSGSVDEIVDGEGLRMDLGKTPRCVILPRRFEVAAECDGIEVATAADETESKVNTSGHAGLTMVAMVEWKPPGGGESVMTIWSFPLSLPTVENVADFLAGFYDSLHPRENKVRKRDDPRLAYDRITVAADRLRRGHRARHGRRLDRRVGRRRCRGRRDRGA
jgi:hypothetical protein